VLFVDERDRRDGVDTARRALEDAGFDVTTAIDDGGFAAIVVAVDAHDERGLPPCARSESALGVPVIVVSDDAPAELALRAAIDGAVECVGTTMVVAAIGDALAPDAPGLTEQQRRARLRALALLSRAGTPEADGARSHVHLTRLEHGPVRTPSPVASPAARLAQCTAKQRELLDVIAREGSVTNAAIALGTSRNTIYASLRRIVHRLQMRDCAELLRLVDSSTH
jgi:DNA-binding CsgD family transcriptional regulator